MARQHPPARRNTTSTARHAANSHGSGREDTRTFGMKDFLRDVFQVGAGRGCLQP
jgi:hypothetical protein